MALPDDFHWTYPIPSQPDGFPTQISCNLLMVVALTRRADNGQWVARLDRHRNGPGGPGRPCRSYDSGRAGAEQWVTRHQDRLRADAAAMAEWYRVTQGSKALRASVPRPFGWLD